MLLPIEEFNSLIKRAQAAARKAKIRKADVRAMIAKVREEDSRQKLVHKLHARDDSISQEWLFLPENREILLRLKKSLTEKATIDLGSFKKHLKK